MNPSTPPTAASAVAPVWEQRWHPLREEWVLFTAHRGGRPWVGETVPRVEAPVPAYDPTCALCPGNERLAGRRNPRYTGVFCFTNDLPTFSDDAPTPGDVRGASVPDTLYRRAPAFGTAEVVCYDPDHSKTFADLSSAGALAVVELWTERQRDLATRPTVRHVLIFENKGAVVGTSNPHPHGQIYAGSLVYGTTEREVASGRRFFARTGGRYLGQAIVTRELADGGGRRVICENADWVACVPWFARYAYEVLVLPRRPAATLLDLDDGQRRGFADILREVTVRYDNLWRMPLPYVMALHQAPTDNDDHRSYPFHVEFHPPLRNPTTLKYLAGPEIGGGSMTNESDPDVKAAELRAAGGPLYREAG